MRDNRLKNSDTKWLERAIEIAKTSQFKQFKTGCILVYKNHILSSACNADKTNPVQKKYNQFRHFNNTRGQVVCHKVHAEIAAMHKVPYPIGLQTDWPKVSVFIARIAPGLEDGIGLARPCPACMQAIRDLGIKNLFYTGSHGSYIYERLP